MRRSHALVLLLVTAVAAGCGERKGRRGPANFIAAEVTTPLHVSVRVYEEDVKPECTETGFARYRCFFQSELVGCTVLELGDEPAEASPLTEDELQLACNVPRAGGSRLLLSSAPEPARGMQLFVDPEGTRIAWRAGADKAAALFYVLDGELIASPDNATATPPPAPMPAWTPDWARIPPLAARAEGLLRDARPSQLPTLFSLMRERRGEAGLGKALVLSIGNADSDPWRDAFSALRPEGRAVWNAAIVKALEEDPGSEILDRLMENPDLRPPRFADLLAKVVEAELAAGWLDSENVPQLVDALLALGDARAGPLACGWLEQAVSATLVSEGDGMPYDYELESSSSALVAVARQKTPCPWVKLALDRDPCNLDYRCTKAGFVETSDEAMEAEDTAASEAAERGDPEPPVLPQNPLCSPAQATRLTDTVKPPWYLPGEEEDDEEELVSYVPVSTLLLAAGHAQTALPADFVRKNERRLYRVDDRSRGDAGVEDEDFSLCDFSDQVYAEPAEIACRVPVTLNRLTLSGCRIDIDDARRVITVTPPTPLPGSATRRLLRGDDRR